MTTNNQISSAASLTAPMVGQNRAQQEPVLHTRVAALRVGNAGESNPRLVNL